MANTFSLILVIATIVTGIIWCLDKFLWAPKRAAEVEAVKAKSNVHLDDEVIASIAPQPVWVEQVVSVFPVIALVMVLRSFIYEPFQIPSGSMMPTLLVGDFILVEKFSYGIKDPVFRSKIIETGQPQRGDVAVFKYPQNPSIDYIKRIIGLPGDRIVYQNKQLYVQAACADGPCGALTKIAMEYQSEGEFMDGPVAIKEYSEALTDELTHHVLINPRRPERVGSYYQQPGTQPVEWIVPEGQYFAMGDNRDDSRDSRFWGFVPEANLVGKAVAIWISFEFGRDSSGMLPTWVPTNVRFNRIGGIE
ncbi:MULTISPECIES: signal peptidase I [unclassified Motilimonas]|uniref:signal peptidase I n=1 Tax=Motilimonas TaxID=1914248 RepID=UPI001E3A1BA6|nr:MULTISPECIES: signal peptidase I [unclassified Motilimonas]MCE0558631.1 signal peptidase I [Motilimonas sp. E26]MDO6527660.1 signal peptidase I [Motilimonas sp. 1_MG-2023]